MLSQATSPEKGEARKLLKAKSLPIMGSPTSLLVGVCIKGKAINAKLHEKFHYKDYSIQDSVEYETAHCVKHAVEEVEHQQG